MLVGYICKPPQSSLQGKSSSAGKAGHFLNLVVRRGPKAYSGLIKALIQTKQTPIAEDLDPRLTQEVKADWESQNGGSPAPARVVHAVKETTQPASGLDGN